MRRLSALATVAGLLVLGAVNLSIGHGVAHEATRKSLQFAVMTVVLVLGVFLLFRHYLYRVLVEDTVWHPAVRPLLRLLFGLWGAGCLAVYPIGRAITQIMPPTNEPFAIMMLVFSCFGALLVCLSLTVATDVMWQLRKLVLHIRSQRVGTASSSGDGSPDSSPTEQRQEQEAAAEGASQSGSLAAATSGSLKQRRAGAGAAPAPAPVPARVAQVIAAIASKPPPPHRPTWIAATVLLLTVLITVAGLWSASKDPVIVRVEVPLRRLPASLDGFRIVQLSDVHVGPTVGASRLGRVVNIANKLDGDIVVLTGDVVDGEEAVYRPALQPLKDLKSRTGDVFFASGNHEFYLGNYRHKCGILRELGITVLNNERVRVPTYSKRYAFPRSAHVGAKASIVAGGGQQAQSVLESEAGTAADMLRTLLDEVSTFFLAELTGEAKVLVHEEELDGGDAAAEPITPAAEQLPEQSAGPAHSQAEVDRETFDLAGVTDWAAAVMAGVEFTPNVTLALEGRDASREVVLLAHQPKQVHLAAAHGVGLQLSGHVHGGQIAPLQLPTWFGNPYFAGLYRHRTPIRGNAVLESVATPSEAASSWWDLFVYVSRGSLYWGPPLRLLAPHEVTLITLRSAAVVGADAKAVVTQPPPGILVQLLGSHRSA